MTAIRKDETMNHWNSFKGKVMIFIFCYVIFLLLPFTFSTLSHCLNADVQEVRYQIRMDQNTENSAEIKEKVIFLLSYLCDHVESNSYQNIIKDNLSYFEQIEGAKAKWKNGRLLVMIEKGDGVRINGTYKESQYCLEAVKPKSKLLEWFAQE